MQNVIKLDTTNDLPKNFYLNKEIINLFEIVENKNINLLLSGKAGTGKSTFIEYLRLNSKKNIQILAFTGVTAIKGKGRTIHSFFALPHRIPNKKNDFRLLNNQGWISKLNLIIIDEISMVRADLLDAIDSSLKINRGNEKPFGGVQMLFVGDVFQLSPIVTNMEKEVLENYYPEGPFFFNSKSYSSINPSYIEFKKVYRQKDKKFIEVLEDIRRNRITNKILDYINQRAITNLTSLPSGLIVLAPTNAKTNAINKKKLNNLKTKEFKFYGTIMEKFNEVDMPTEKVLELKVGAQVMMIKNDRNGRWVNGTIGIVVDLTNFKIIVRSGCIEYEVLEEIWEKWDYKLEGSKYEPIVIGTFKQYPIKLAWAATIHKCQGQTFKEAIVDFDNGAFSHGMAYVALSRVKSLKGLFLTRGLQKSDVISDSRISNFIAKNELL